jgi:hypothetical protein
MWLVSSGGGRAPGMAIYELVVMWWRAACSTQNGVR